jgi:hypothetical protein
MKLLVPLILPDKDYTAFERAFLSDAKFIS